MFKRQDISGNNISSDALVNHQIVPSTLTDRLYGTVLHQQIVYKSLRKENPGVNIHAPAIAHSIAGWAIHANPCVTSTKNT